MGIKEISLMGGVLVVLFVLLIVLKLQNRKIRTFLRSNAAGKTSAGSGSKKRGGGGGRFVNVELLQEGDMLGDDVRDVAGKVVLLETGTELSQKNIDKLMKWGIKSVLIQ